MKFRIRYADQVVGVFILLAIAFLAVIVIAVGSNQRWFARDYYYRSRFPSASGLSSGTAITMKGFPIGRIKKVTLTESNEADVLFAIYDTYVDRARVNSLLELVVSPIGLGNQLLFHPGKSTALAAENSFIPAYDTPEGKALVAAKLVDMPPKDDTITRLLSNINPLLENVNATVLEVQHTLVIVNSVLEGQGSGPVQDSMQEIVAAIAKVNGLLDELDLALAGKGGGPIAGMLNGVDGIVADVGDALQGRGASPIAGSLRGVNSLMTEVNQALRGEGGGALAQSVSGVNRLVGSANATVAQTLPRVDGMMAEVETSLPLLLQRVDGIVAEVQTAVPTMLATVNRAVDSVAAIGANLEATTAAIADPTGLIPKLLAPEGSIKTFLNDGDQLFNRVDNSLAQVESAIGNLATTTAILTDQMPRIAAIIDEARAAIIKAQDVLEGLKNNPLLSGGIPERVEAQAAPTNLRTTDF